MKKITKMMSVLMIALLAIFTLAFQGKAQTTLLTEGWESAAIGTTPPAGWGLDLFTYGNWTSWVASGSLPAAAPYEGSRFVQFDSWDAPSGYENRLKRTTALSTVGYQNISVDFTMFRQSTFSGDGIYVEWSTNGTVWNTAGALFNTNQGGPLGWAIFTQALPAGAANQATLYIAFRFHSAYGYNVYMDICHVTGLQTGNITGTVTSCFSGAPLAGVSCSVPGLPAVLTNGAGVYTINGVSTGPATVTGVLAGYVTGTGTGTVLANQTVTINFCLNPIPAIVTGIITNASNGLPIVGAKVTTVPPGSIPAVYSTGPTGTYSLNIYPAGSYGVKFHKEGFIDTTILTATYTPPTTYTVNMGMMENTNPPTNVAATLNVAQTAVTINWGLPVGNYELLYDDGKQENFTVWASSGNYDAVKFTPVGYPATVLGGTINIGTSANYPGGSAPFVPFEMSIYDATGAGGTPGTLLAGPYTTTPVANQYGWIALQGFPGAGITIASGSFFLVMKQIANYPNVLGVAIDTTTIQLRSYQKFGSTVWVPISGNFLMRAIVNGSGGPVPLDAQEGPRTITASSVPEAMYDIQPGIFTGLEGTGSVIPLPGGTDEVITGYQVWRLLQGQELTPGVWTSVGATATMTMTDNSWPSLPCNAYRWAVKAQYTGNRWSSGAFSNVIGKCWTANVTVNVALSCAADSTLGVLVQLINTAYPDTNYSKIMDASGTVTFTNVWKGTYTLNVMGFPYSLYTQNLTVLSDQVVNLVLMQVKIPPRGLTVDDKSLLGTWWAPASDVPLLDEQWTSGNFTANQWVVNGSNWSVTTAIGKPQPSLMFIYTPTLMNYNSYVTSKDLTGMFSPTLQLKYDIYLDNYSLTNENTMAVEIWDGTNWNVLKSYTNMNGSIPWTSESLDISAYTSKTFKIRFHAAGVNSYDINNWNIDNINITASKNTPKPNPCILGYNFYLNNVLDGFTMDTSYLIPANHVNYGTVYQACVLAIYGSGYSTRSCYTFTSHFLYPPTQMNYEVVECSVLITWKKPQKLNNVQVTDVQPRTEFPNNGADYSPVIISTTNNYTNTDVLWDLLFSWNSSQGAAPGVEADAANVYTASWQTGFGAPPWIHQYQKMTGTLVQSFDCGSASAIRDMASDPTIWPVFYGSNGATSIFKMNFTTHTLVSTINAAVASARHLAYDPGLDGGLGGFWTGGWTDMFAIRMNGTVLYAGPTQNNTYGSAYDNQSAGGPYIWTYSQSGAHLQDLTQFKIQATPPYLVATGITHDAGTIPGLTAGIAGGLCTGQVNQKYALIGNSQLNPDAIWALEIANWSGGGGTPNGLIGYNVYRDGGLIAHLVPGPDTLQYWDMNLNPGTYVYGVSAFYDLTLYGFPGTFGESLPDGPLTVNLLCGVDLPFFEPWDQASFAFNSWSFTNGIQGNWIMNNGLGNPAPTADFSWQPIKINYSYALETPTLNAGPWTCANIYLDFDLRLEDRNATGNEKLEVEVFYNNKWNSKTVFSDSGSFNWKAKHFDISSVKGKGFKVRFRAHGANSSDILHWYVDNIHIYGVCKPPTGLAVSQSHENTTLTWVAPDCAQGGGTVMEFIFDDGSAENGWAINPGFLVWLGNEMPISATYTGVLQMLHVYFMDPIGNTDQTLTIDVFDGTQTLVGSSAPFLAIQDVWIDLAVNDIPFSGMFYLMVKWNMQPALSHYLGYDENGPFSGQDLEWYYDGTAWQKLTALAGANPGVFLLRATGLVQGNLKSVELVPGQVPKVAPFPVQGLTNARGFSDSHNYTTMGPVDGPQSDSTVMLGYNVYRTDETGVAPFLKLNAAPVTALTYVDVIDPAAYGDYCYYVTDVFWTSEKNATLCESATDTICIHYPAVGINEVPAGTISVYPNPATDVVKVVSSYDIRNIQLLNYIGQVVLDNRSVNSKLTQFNVSGFQSGVYFVKITTDQGIKTTKITVTK